MGKNSYRKYSEDEFYEEYELDENHINTNASFDGNMFERYGYELDYVLKMAKLNRVITILEVDDELYYSSGYHIVNRLGYFITTYPITEDFEVKLEDF